ncbi:hypothetical protein J3B02_000947 [Coemansia erecta]|uniref:glucan endo-1,3-beta-D-glucosidase n=1 Tax=Coemansia asiatica TaxID=1052880 RepID=A0A9W8CKG7_9FUNG|nr:hypothetical protein LPJ64_003010 [Coemansia asiatica]KAJ2857509.1 hypothetical protein J3B02_000947 [Coemansia erecta]KAJ2888950.1 hypothetical protein FB639_000271 [Coemansia asiatica]
MDSGVADNQHTPPPYDYQEIPDFTTTSSKKSTITRTVVVTKHKSTTSLNSVIQSTLPTSLSVSSSVQSSANNNNNIINNVASSFNENGLLWGLTYSPYNTDGSCPDANAVADQLAKVAKVTKNIRLYSTDCSQLENALQAITSNNLGLSIHAGIWISDGQARMQSDLDQFVSAAKKFGTSLIKGVSVGNEDISKGMSESTLIDYINQVRSRLQAEGLGSIPVYTTEQDKLFTFNMAAASDKVVVNIHAIFDSQFYSIDASVQSVIQRANNVKTKVASGKPVVIGETGWSSAGNTGSCPLTLANEIAFAQKFRCAADAAGYTYFYFEAKNAKWKKDAATSEQNFGIFDAGFTPKFDFNLLSVC